MPYPYVPPTEAEYVGSGATPNKGAKREIDRNVILWLRSLLGTDGTKAAAATAMDVPTNAQAAQINGFRNVVMNGNMAISQEFGTASTTITAGASLKYVVDGWYVACTGANVTAQQVITNNKASLVITGLASNTGVTLGHRIESADSYSMAGLFATLSLLVSSSTLTTINYGIYYANSKDAFGTIASPTRTTIQTGAFTGITSTAALKSAITSAVLAAGANTGIEIVFTTGALLATQTLTITDVQLEKGSIASPVFANESWTTQRLRARRRTRTVVAINGTSGASTSFQSSFEHEGMFAAPLVSATAALVYTQTGIGVYTQSAANAAVSAQNTADGGDYIFGNFTGITVNVPGQLRTTGGKILLSAQIP
jgi:hypothetical protein